VLIEVYDLGNFLLRFGFFRKGVVLGLLLLKSSSYLLISL
jgi:hypothetical protein